MAVKEMTVGQRIGQAMARRNPLVEYVAGTNELCEIATGDQVGSKLQAHLKNYVIPIRERVAAQTEEWLGNVDLTTARTTPSST